MTNKDYSKWTKEQLAEEVKWLRKRKKYGLVWEDKPEDVVELCKTELPVLKEVKNKAITKGKNGPVNILIEGDNYHALSVLNYTHKGKIDVIYIDPPYNTGAKDWKYNNDFVDINDGYRHSKWLSMMNTRLALAKKLLKRDGVLICTIDDNEQAHLGTLLEELFPDYEIHCITIVHNPRGIQGKNFSYTHEYAFFVFRNGLKVIRQRKIETDDIDWRNLRDNGGGSLRTDAKNCFYPVVVKGGKIVDFGDVAPSNFHPKKQTVRKGPLSFVFPVDRRGIERKWRYARQSVETVAHLLRAKQTETGYEIEIGKDFGTVRTVWQDSRHDANEWGTKLVHALVPKTSFDFPKSLWNTYDCLAPIISARKNAIVLDYFAGSGTTGHAVFVLNKLNGSDGGERQFILCTNNENNIATDVCYPRIKAVIDGHKDYRDITGIPSNLIYFRTAFVGAEPNDKNKEALTKQATEMLCMREETFELVKEAGTVKIFKNSKQHTGIVFDEDAIPALKKEIAKIGGAWSVYIFSLGDDTFEDEFEDMKQKITVAPIPEAILRVYRRLFKS
ncbi:MAG: site-specific DNA-methyltransferase [Acidobacteriia bacterium]|nr:site-specific DNA-methyltransferase [Terriglobia bacterium]